MDVIDRTSPLWNYMAPEIQDLFEDGEIVLTFVHENRANAEKMISDFSFLVFPFAKAYEGFLKRFLFDTQLIKEEEYYSDEIRIGRILNPYFIKEKSNVFNKVCGGGDRGKEVAKRLWKIWKRGRNLVFHYFPHNHRRLTYDEALDIINEIVNAMNQAVRRCKV